MPTTTTEVFSVSKILLMAFECATRAASTGGRSRHARQAPAPRPRPLRLVLGVWLALAVLGRCQGAARAEARQVRRRPRCARQRARRPQPRPRHGRPYRARAAGPPTHRNPCDGAGKTGRDAVRVESHGRHYCSPHNVAVSQRLFAIPSRSGYTRRSVIPSPLSSSMMDILDSAGMHHQYRFSISRLCSAKGCPA